MKCKVYMNLGFYGNRKKKKLKKLKKKKGNKMINFLSKKNEIENIYTHTEK